ncbi:motility associated factor glycosyltransferase family protein [Paenibacillus chungangensis]|uniref:6-hydroxymethylpterin diphosphokinase MptE-like protein n=1 Tax=Paenibacillus chungangensis TaxID=696535 RepID=A0ABW3HWU4_9BACL
MGLKQEINHITDELIDFLPQLIDVSTIVGDSFYGNMNNESWLLVGQIVTAIDDLYKTLVEIENMLIHVESNHAWKKPINDYIARIEVIFARFNEHTDADEFVMAGDIIRYEFIPLFHSLLLFLGKTEEESNKQFSTNLLFLQEKYPLIYDRVFQLQRDELNYQIISSKDGNANLYLNTPSGQFTNMYSEYDINTEVVRWVAGSVEDVKESQFVLLFGVGFGYHLKEFALKYPKIKIFLVEPDPQVFLASMYAVNWEETLAGIDIVDFALGVKELDDVELLLERFCVKTGSKLNIQDLPKYQKYFKEHKVTLLQHLKYCASKFKLNEKTLDYRYIKHTKNILNNIAANLSTPSVRTLNKRLDGIPAIVVGAGPSLEADVEYLKQLRDHCLIIAAGSSVQSLQHFGIKPHLIVSIDGSDKNYVAFKPINREDIPFIYCPQIDYRVVDLQYEKTYHAYLKNDYISKYIMGYSEANGDPVFKETNSVSGTAVQIAIYLGAKEVIFTGQDLSYPSDSMYAPGAKQFSEKEKLSILSEADQWIENNKGSNNKISTTMLVTLRNFENMLTLFPDVKFINASSKGAKIKHAVYEPMGDIVKRMSSDKVSMTIEDIFKNEKYHYNKQSEMKEKLFALPQQMQNSIKLTHRMNNRLKKLMELSRTNPNKCLKMMSSIEKDWGDLVKSIPLNTIYQYALKNKIIEFDRYQRQLSEERNIQKKARLFERVLGQLFDAIIKHSPELLSYLEEAIERVHQLERVTLQGDKNV